MKESNFSVNTLSQIFEGLKPTPAAYLEAEREIAGSGFENLKPIRAAILSTFTIDLLKPYVMVESVRRGLAPELYFAPFSQLEQQIFDKQSDLYRAKPDVIILAARLEDWAPELVFRFLKLSAKEIESEMEQIRMRLQTLIQNIRRETSASILLFNYQESLFLAAGLADASLEFSQSSAIRKVNEQLSALASQSSGICIFDYARLVGELGIKRCYDAKLWYMARLPWSAEAQMEIGKRLARYLRALFMPACKCLVLDLDNTLWGGVLGEEGMEGIALGEDYPGNVFKDFHRRLLSLRDRGILLAIASKNNEADALRVFEQHPDCLLKLKDFASYQIHWQDKAQSLAAIAKDLNISTEALAFLDDNPVEREWIRAQMPEVTVIDVSNPMDLLAFEASGAFDQLIVSKEDKQRTEFFQHERERKQFQSESVSLEDFLKKLEMKATVGVFDSETLPRIGQLLSKTNQFNLTTRRHSAEELNALLQAGAIGLWIRVSDRFGDYGLVGAVLALPKSKTEWSINTFLLSCRVIGRKVEDLLLALLSQGVKEKGGEFLTGEYIATPKNAQVADFYQKLGFESIPGKKNFWQWDLKKGILPQPGFIQVRFQ